MKRLIPYWLRIELRRVLRWLSDLPKRTSFSTTKTEDRTQFPVELTAHSSKIVRHLSPEYATLQQNKVRNLEIACSCLNGLVIQPGEVFSFCRMVGRTSRKKGYVDGLEMHNGELIGSPGGGLCQLANLIFWMAVHLDLEIVERHRHEMDLFPDDERKVPFGMGATVFYNYRDLQIRNTLQQPLLLSLTVHSPLLKGAFLAPAKLDFEVEIYETMDRFIRAVDGTVWRENRVSKRILYSDGRTPFEAEIAHNKGRTCYPVPPEKVEEATV